MRGQADMALASGDARMDRRQARPHGASGGDGAARVREILARFQAGAPVLTLQAEGPDGRERVRPILSALAADCVFGAFRLATLTYPAQCDAAALRAAAIAGQHAELPLILAIMDADRLEDDALEELDAAAEAARRGAGLHLLLVAGAGFGLRLRRQACTDLLEALHDPIIVRHEDSKARRPSRPHRPLAPQAAAERRRTPRRRRWLGAVATLACTMMLAAGAAASVIVFNGLGTMPDGYPAATAPSTAALPAAAPFRGVNRAAAMVDQDERAVHLAGLHSAPADPPAAAHGDEANGGLMGTAGGPDRSGPQTSPPIGDGSPSAPGLALVMEAGDTLPNLYALVYAGREAPPLAAVAALNPRDLGPGSVAVFPPPRNGWAP